MLPFVQQVAQGIFAAGSALNASDVAVTVDDDIDGVRLGFIDMRAEYNVAQPLLESETLVARSISASISRPTRKAKPLTYIHVSRIMTAPREP